MTEFWKDIGYVAVLELPKPWDTGGYYGMDFRVYKADFSNDGVPIYTEASEPVDIPTDDIAKARVFASGTVKWDGCVNFKFDEQENCMLHCCSQQEVLDIGTLLGRLYVLAAKMVPNNDFEDELKQV